MRRIKQSAVDQSLETIRNRIDQFGVSEPIIQRQGDRDILIQLPGIQDPERAKELIGKTAVLEFKLVRDVNAEPIAKGKQPLPAGTQMLYELSKGDRSASARKGQPLLVESQHADDRRRRRRCARAAAATCRTAASSRSISTRAARGCSRRSPPPTSTAAWRSCSTTRSIRRR